MIQDPRSQDSRSKIQDPKIQDPRSQDLRSQDLRSQDPGNLDPSNLDPENFYLRNLDPRNLDPRNLDPRNLDPRYLDPRNLDPRYLDPRNRDPRKTAWPWQGHGKAASSMSIKGRCFLLVIMFLTWRNTAKTRITLITLTGHGTYHKMICKGSQSRKTSFLTGKTCEINFQSVFVILW